MALLKTIKKANGVYTSYHRIAMIKVDLNQQITVLVESYVDEEGRDYEKAYAAGEIEGEPVFPYTDSEYIPIEWDETGEFFEGNIMEKAYGWLKKQPDYINSEDV